MSSDDNHNRRNDNQQSTLRLFSPNSRRRITNRRHHRQFTNHQPQQNLWPNGIIPYRIAPELWPYRPRILRAMKNIQQNTCIEFRPHSNELDYVQLIYGNGCHSIVGYIGNGRQTISLGEGCHDLGSIIHELCHTIGLYHEHMRYDRDNYLRIQWSNIEPQMYEQFYRLSIDEYKPKHRFDYNSIMIYGSRAFSRNGRPTMVPLNSRVRLRESHFKRSLSAADIVNINSMYDC